VTSQTDAQTYIMTLGINYSQKYDSSACVVRELPARLAAASIAPEATDILTSSVHLEAERPANIVLEILQKAGQLDRAVSTCYSAA
jgi:hypothetical protein